MKIFLVDDEKILSTAIKKKLFQYGYMLEVFTSFSSLVDGAARNYCDLYIVDISLPDKDGFAVIHYLRNSLWLDTPIIVLSWYQGVEYKVQALNLWADDYMTKPFSSDELIARIRSIMRRKWASSNSSQLEYKNISLNLCSRDVTKNKAPIPLTKKEKQILEFLMFNVWRLVTKTEIISSVWEKTDNYEDIENTLWVTLFNMRQKLWEWFDLETKVREWYILKD